MTDRTTYYQRKNRHALTTGGVFRCPSCIGVVSMVENIDHLHDGLGNIPSHLYHCQPCNYFWKEDGEPIRDETEKP